MEVLNSKTKNQEKQSSKAKSQSNKSHNFKTDDFFIREIWRSVNFGNEWIYFILSIQSAMKP